MPFLVIYFHDVRGLGLGTAGLAVAISAAAQLAAGIGAGPLIDRIGPRPTLATGLVLQSIGFGLLPLVRHPLLAFVLIAVELNRPGYVLPGAAGLLLALLAAAALVSRHPRPAAILQILASMLVLLLPLRRTVHWLVTTAASLVFVAGLGTLLRSVHGFISWWAAILCGLFVGAGITVLTGVARRARQNKGLD